MAKEKQIVAYTTEEDFKQAVREAGELNRDIKYQTAQLKELKPRLIKYMQDNGVSSIEDGPYKASYQVANKSTMDEDKVIALIEKKIRQAKRPERKELLAGAIETVKQINEDKLSELIFDGVISAKDLEQYTTTTVQNKIRLDYKK